MLKIESAFPRMFSGCCGKNQSNQLTPRGEIGPALTGAAPSGPAGTAGTTTTAGSAAATGAAAAGSGRLITRGFTCDQSTKILSNQLSHSSYWDIDTVGGEGGGVDTPLLGHWAVEGPACLSRGPVRGKLHDPQQGGSRKRTRHRCYSRFLRGFVSGRQPGAAGTVRT